MSVPSSMTASRASAAEARARVAGSHSVAFNADAGGGEEDMRRGGADSGRGDSLQDWISTFADKAWAVVVSLGGVWESMQIRTQACTSLRLIAMMSFLMMHGRSNLPFIYRVLPFHNDVEAIRNNSIPWLLCFLKLQETSGIL